MKSVNKVILLGNLTRDPEFRHTEHDKAVCSFGLATNRIWTTETRKKREEPEYHRLVAWEKLAEFCDKYLRKGRKVYVEGRLQTRSYTAKDGTSAQISCKKPMALPNPQKSVFLDSSVLYATAFSPTGPARRLILKGFAGHITLCISDLVIAETQRNLAKNAPEALPYFLIIADLLSNQITRPTKAEVLKAAQIVHLKDAAIVAAAAKVKADYLTTHDVKHLLTHAQAIAAAYGVTVIAPSELLSILTN